MAKLAAILFATAALSVLLQPIPSVQGTAIKHGRTLKQGAGVGAGCDSILTQADNGAGYTVEDTENALGGDIGGAGKMGKKLLSYLGLNSNTRALKQGAGFGAACNSILTQADNGAGYTIEDTENALGGDMKQGKGMTGGTGRKLSQLDKIANGANVVLSAGGDPQLGHAVQVVGDDYDGQGTNDAATAGMEVGQAEASLPEATQAIPGRRMLGQNSGRKLSQLDKMANGANVLLTAAGDPQTGHAVQVVGDDYDGQGTNDAATAGMEVGQAEASLPEATQAIPGRRLSQLDKIANGANVLLSAAGDPQTGHAVQVVGDDYDGQGTNDAATTGMEVGQAEASLPEATQAIPGRKLSQLDKIANGADVVLSAAGDPQTGNAVKVVGDDYDGQGTNDAATTGMEVGQAEASLPEATQAIPGRKMLAATKHSRALKQGAGVGAGCDSILTQADNGAGYTVEDTEDTLGGDVGGAGKIGKKLLSHFGSHKRALKQGAGVGAGCNSILTQADNGAGYTVEDTEDALGGDANQGKGMTGRKLSQLDKIANGADVVLSAAGDPQTGNAVKVVGDDYDGQGTNDAATTGMEVGQAEASLPEATQAIPGRKF